MKAEVDVLGSPVPNSPYGLCGRKAILTVKPDRAQELCESRGGCLGHPVPNTVTVLVVSVDVKQH